jgi:ABC-type glycerol-3-phosphate transport system substrate-binding protein
MSARSLLKSTVTTLALCGSLISAGFFTAAQAEVTELKIGYMKHPIQDASVEIMDKWAKENGINLVKIPMAYSIFMEKVTATLTSGGDQFDVIWHNDDWGQLWIKWMETTDDVAGMDQVARSPLDAFYDENGNVSVVPMTHTVGTFFYRTDLIGPDEVPTTWEELVEVSQRLQEEGKVKWGYVGGMAMNNTWFSLWWTMWSNKCDIFLPLWERDNAKLAAADWTPALTEPCTKEYVEFWWDALNTHKISPEAMTSYTRDEANAIFMAGDAAFTLVDSTHYGDFNNPQKSRVAGNVGMAPWPKGPRGEVPFAWNEIWGWGIPKSVPEDRKAAAKEMLGALLLDAEGQVEMWNKTGGPPPNTAVWEKLEKEDEVFGQLKNAVFDQDAGTHSAYYFANWPAVHKAYSDVMVGALKGAREGIPAALEAGMEPIHKAAVGH